MKTTLKCCKKTVANHSLNTMIYTLLNTGYKYVAVSALLYLISIERDISKTLYSGTCKT